jgi:hypothetical protein
MPEQLVVNIVRPEVRIEYRSEKGATDVEEQVAACELALHALAKRTESLYARLGRRCPAIVTDLVQSNLWERAIYGNAPD